MNNPNDVTRLKHLDSLAGKVNVLGTAPQTVNGGLWFDSDAHAINLLHNDKNFSVELTPAPDFIIGGCGFNFSGFANLDFHDGKIYAADDTSHTTELGTVTTTFDGSTLKSCSISVTNSAAFATGATNFSIEQVAGQTVKLYLAIDISGTTTEGTTDRQWGYSDNVSNTLFYVSTPASGGTYTKTSEISYTKSESFTDATEGQQIFKLTGLDNPSALITDAKYDGTADINLGTSVKGVVATEERDSSGYITNVTFTVSADALPTNPTSKTVISGEYMYAYVEGKDYTSDVTYVVKAADDVPMFATKPATWAAYGDIYDFTDVTKIAGYIESEGKLTYATGQPADSFSITGLVSALVMVQNGDNYDVYKSTDVTNGTPKSGATVLATKQAYELLIKDASIIDGFTEASAATIKNQFTVALTNNPLASDNKDYALNFDTTIATKLTTENDSTPAYLEASDATGTTYTYNPAVTGWKFQKTDACTYTFVPKKTATVTPFTLNGLASGLGTLTVDAEGNIYSGTNIIGTFDGTRVTLNSKAIPAEADREDISITGTDSYRLNFDSSVTTAAAPSLPIVNIGPNNTVVYRTSGTRSYYQRTSKTSFIFHAANPYEQFLIGGLKVVSDISITDGIITAEGDITVGSASGSTFTPNANFLPDNPDASTEISIDGTGTLALATDSATAAVSQTFDTDLWTSGATAGTHSYTFTSATTGFYLADEQHIRYNATNLTGKTFTLTGLRTDLGQLAFDEHGYIRATNGSTVGRMFGTTIQLYENAVHSLFAPSLTGEGFTLVLP